MRLTVFFDHRFLRAGDGVVYSPKSYDYEFLKRRYLDVFSSLRVVSRVEPAIDTMIAPRSSEGDGVTIVQAGSWRGPLDYAKQQCTVRKAVAAEIDNAEAVLMIVPGQLARRAHAIMPDNRPFGVEVVGDPLDAFAPGANAHPLRAFFRWNSARDLRLILMSATAASYVTESSLQSRYPTSEGAVSVGCSDVDLDPESVMSEPRAYSGPLNEPRIVFVGTLEQMYKRPDVLIEALHRLRTNGILASAVIVGGGKHQYELERKAFALGLQSSVDFVGNVPAGEKVRSYLRDADIFVLPSQQEGLPRAMIEAMAQAMPVIGTRIGGIPELIHEDDLIPANDVDALAAKIAEVASNSNQLSEMSRRNLQRSQDFHNDVLQARRVEMQNHLRLETDVWLSKYR